MKEISVILCLTLSACILSAQTITIKPYLQDAEPNSIYILWETDSMEESIVEWGPTAALGNTSMGTAQVSVGDARIHEVKLENLQRFTTYFYRVKTAGAVSETYTFKTAPFASDHHSFKIVAMSDMQRDGNFPDKFEEIIEEGVIDYLNESSSETLVDNLALVMIPGDLVSNGNNYNSWKETFFNPAEDLFSHIPVYPVPGNHENNATYYFQYFKLPDNGTTGFEEHWWYKDYGNVRIIGLDSNSPFTNQEQLEWLDTLLDTTCETDSIDFVFAQLHHPYKSELWTPGELDYTGEVISSLEQFTSTCNKPSIHFFGHTHGYSRGQSRDHKHLWINVASAGGAIDNWGEFPNFDYEEFSLSQDEYGFVVVEVSGGEEPAFTVKRISRGDQDVTKDNEVTDSIAVSAIATIVNTPDPVSPVDEVVIPECVTLTTKNFSSPEVNSVHGQSHWQVALEEDDFLNPIAESWENFENWYFDENTQLGESLASEKIEGLSENTSYKWRVRFRDRSLNWSEWSSTAAFSTTTSFLTPNLLNNPGAEDSLMNWMGVEGVTEALTAGVCNGISPHSGTRYFAVGGLCEHSELARCLQNVDVSAHADSIDSGAYRANFGGYLSNFSGSDLPEMRLVFLDQNSLELGTSITLSTLNASWTLFNEWTDIPEQTRIIQFELKGTRNAGTDNDAYFDDLFLRLGPDNIDCDELISGVRSSSGNLYNLKVTPNPMSSEGRILLPANNLIQPKLYILDAKGIKMNPAVSYQKDSITIDKGNLLKGTYFFLLRDRGQLIGKGKFIIL